VARTHASKLDELLRLSHEREGQLADLAGEVAQLRAVVADQAKQIKAMKPTVDQVAAAVTFGRVGSRVAVLAWRYSFRAGLLCVAIAWWMNDRWHLLGPLFRRTP